MNNIRPTCAGFFNRDAIEDPDNLPIAFEDGVISVHGSTWYGSQEGYGIVDFKVVLGKRVIFGLMTREQAEVLHALLEEALDAARDDDAENPNPDGILAALAKAEAEAE